MQKGIISETQDTLEKKKNELGIQMQYLLL